MIPLVFIRTQILILIGISSINQIVFPCKESQHINLLQNKKNKIEHFLTKSSIYFQITTFWWFWKIYTAIVNSLKKNTRIVCTVFPSRLHKYKLHVETTSGHEILCWYTLFPNKWNLIIN